MVAHSLDQLPLYLIEGRPLVQTEQMPGRPATGRVRRERDDIVQLRKQHRETCTDLKETKKLLARLAQQVERLEAAAAENVIPMAGRRKKAK